MPVTDKPGDCLILIFGASGDLTSRKLIPALMDLYCQKQMPEHFAVLGVSRSELSDEDFRSKLKEWSRDFATEFCEDQWQAFEKHLYYHAGDSTKLKDFEGIKQRVAELSDKHKTGQNVLFYLSLAPHLYDPTIENVGQAHMVTEGKAWCSINRTTRPWQRIIVEKPFGSDPDSARHLNRVLGRVFEEESIYRIDHYLGKETVQNILAFRFANAIFEPLWNRNYIDHVQVTATETVGVEGRGGYYDSPSGGAMRDMLQGHLVQIMALVAMEPPISMLADDIRNEKAKILDACRVPIEGEIPNLAVKGQYGAGMVSGKAIPAYRDEEGVAADSQTDTYAAMKVYLDTWRWEGVPFYLRSGKAMARKTTEVVVEFKKTPHALFKDQMKRKSTLPNQFIMNIQPDEGIRLRFEGKVPGLGMHLKPVEMEFDYASQFNAKPPEAYATLLLEAMKGDQTNFKNRRETESAWEIAQPILDYWAENPSDNLPNYNAGTWGPSDADIMLARDGRAWHNR